MPDKFCHSVLPLVVERLGYLKFSHTGSIEYLQDFVETTSEQGAILLVTFADFDVEFFGRLVKVPHSINEQSLIQTN